MARTARYINIDGVRAFNEVPGDRISAPAYAKAILHGVERNASLITPSAARWISLAYRLAPNRVATMMRGVSGRFVALREEYPKAARTSS